MLLTENIYDQLVRMKPDDGSDDIWLSTCHILDDFMTSATDSIVWSHVETGITTSVTVLGCDFDSWLLVIYSYDASCEAT